MPYQKLLLQVYELVFYSGVLIIAAFLILASFVSFLVDLAIRRLLIKPSSKTPRLPLVRCQVKVNRGLTSQRPSPSKTAKVVKTTRPVNLKGWQIKAMVDKMKSSDCERLAIIRSMAADADQILMRLQRARARSQARRKAEEERIKGQKQGMAPTVQSSWQTFRRLNALMKERTRENEICLRQIRDRTRVPLNLMKEWEAELNSSRKAGGKEAFSATKSADENKADLTPSESGGIRNKEVSVARADNDHMDDSKDRQADATDNAFNHKETKRDGAIITPVCKVRGDTKVIKMKVEASNTLEFSRKYVNGGRCEQFVDCLYVA